MHGDALLAFAAGTAAEVAEPEFGDFEFAVWDGEIGDGMGALQWNWCEASDRGGGDWVRWRTIAADCALLFRPTLNAIR
jgi:hypothetical protein